MLSRRKQLVANNFHPENFVTNHVLFLINHGFLFFEPVCRLFQEGNRKTTDRATGPITTGNTIHSLSKSAVRCKGIWNFFVRHMAMGLKHSSWFLSVFRTFCHGRTLSVKIGTRLLSGAFLASISPPIAQDALTFAICVVC